MDKVECALINGKIFSIGLEGQRTTGTAIAIQNGRIKKVGSDEEIKAEIDEKTKVIDCQGNTILPGLCDAHCHPSISASSYSGCDLFGVYIQRGESADQVIEQYKKRLKQFIQEHPKDLLIRGTGWVMGNFTGARVPTRQDLDELCGDKPVILESFCQHNLWVNTKALEIAGVDQNTPNPYAGQIYREEDGYPSGIFREPEAMDLIKENVPGYDFSVAQYKEALCYYQKELANKYGVTLVQDCMHSDNARQAYKELAQEGKLTLRMRGVYLLEPSQPEQLSEYILRKGDDDVDDKFKIETIKIFAEGEFALIEPYEQDFLKKSGLPEVYNGPLFWKDDKLIEVSSKAIEAGFAVHIHAMGDGAVRQSVHCLARAQQKARDERRRNVVAHLMLIHDEDILRMGKEKIIANCQPRWMVYDSDIEGMLAMVGKDRAEKAYPLRGFFDKGVRVAFGTDFPVTPPPDTMHEIQCAMTRSVFPDAPDYEKFKGKKLGQEVPASLEEAIQALSINGAYQMSLENVTGSIEEGKSADLVILDRDLEKTPKTEIYSLQIYQTLFEGKVVYEKEDQ